MYKVNILLKNFQEEIINVMNTFVCNSILSQWNFGPDNKRELKYQSSVEYSWKVLTKVKRK